MILKDHQKLCIYKYSDFRACKSKIIINCSDYTNKFAICKKGFFDYHLKTN